jgi:RNA polymerase sigma factor (TIGR02999 family)
MKVRFVDEATKRAIACGTISGILKTPTLRLSMSEVTRILFQIEEGDGQAAEQLLPLVYHELRQLAAQKMAQENPGQTLEPTALVHEAYIRLVDGQQAQHWDSRGHFFAAAAEAMRRILVDRARQKLTLKQGGQVRRADIDLARLPHHTEGDDILAIHEALELLEIEHPPIAKLVKLKYFAGLTLEETAAILGISIRTAHRHWAYARAWLLHTIVNGSSAESAV